MSNRKEERIVLNRPSRMTERIKVQLRLYQGDEYVRSLNCTIYGYTPEEVIRLIQTVIVAK